MHVVITIYFKRLVIDKDATTRVELEKQFEKSRRGESGNSKVN